MESSTDCAKEQVCLEQDEPTMRSLYERLQGVPDHRKRRGKRYEGAVVLILLVLAKLAGETKMSGIAQWARLRAEWLSQVLSLHAGKAPCANIYQLIVKGNRPELYEVFLIDHTGAKGWRLPVFRAETGDGSSRIGAKARVTGACLDGPQDGAGANCASLQPRKKRGGTRT